jgi:hypothetical protein
MEPPHFRQYFERDNSLYTYHALHYGDITGKDYEVLFSRNARMHSNQQVYNHDPALQ